MTSSSQPIRILSYNIRLTLERGISAVVDTIRHINADVVALQEVGDHWPYGPNLALAEHLAEQADYAHNIFAGALFEEQGAYGIAMLSRWPLSDAQTELLPRRDDEQRLVLKLKLAHANLTIWNTHLSIKSWDREQQLRRLQVAVKDEAPDILAGDLNTVLSDPELKSIPLTNAWSTQPAPTYPTNNPQITIDHIMYGNRWEVLEQTQVHSSKASDHLPISATFRMSSNA